MTPEPRKEFSPRQYAISLGGRIEYIVSHPDEYPETVEAVEEEIQSTLVRFHTQTIQSVRERVDMFPVYYRSKFSQDCSREETEEERSTEMIELKLLTDLLKDLEAPVEDSPTFWKSTIQTLYSEDDKTTPLLRYKVEVFDIDTSRVDSFTPELRVITKGEAPVEGDGVNKEN